MTHEHFVLVVEDDTDCRELVAELLAENGFQTATGANGVEALQQLREHRADQLAPAGYLSKPIEPHQLIDCIAQHCPRMH